MRRNPKGHLNGKTTKRRKIPQPPLCNLPMDVLSHILSQLPINDAIRTTVLSKKWKYIWRCHTNLTFDPATMRKHYFKTSSGDGFINDKEFIARVHTVLNQHSGERVEHMEVKFGLHNKHAAHIDRWVNFAIAAKTKELVIDLSGGHGILSFRNLSYDIHRVREEPYTVPSQLFSTYNGSHLKHLDLTTVSLRLPADFIGFPNLKHLTLVDVCMNDEDVQRMLSGCNLLEFFKIAYCRTATRIKISHPLDQLKHLVLDDCPLLQEIELNCSPMTLVYSGTVVPIVLASSSRLTSISIKFLTAYHDALNYIVTGFPSMLQSLETLTLHYTVHKKTIFPVRPLKFTYLRHLRLELILRGNEESETDILNYAYLLEVAPFMQKLELIMFMNCRYRPYRKKDGKLRRRLPHQHAHLKFVRISGFFGHKIQLELALHILHSSIVLEKMEITPKVEISYSPDFARICFERNAYVDGHNVATEFICKEDHRNVVDAERASFSWGPRLNYGRRRGT